MDKCVQVISLALLGLSLEDDNAAESVFLDKIV